MAVLSGADFSEAHLRYAYLEGADLSQALLSGADLGRSWLTDLTTEDLSGTNFANANIQDANVNGSDVSKVVNLTQTQVATARGDSSTKLPGDLNTPESWKKK